VIPPAQPTIALQVELNPVRASLAPPTESIRHDQKRFDSNRLAESTEDRRRSYRENVLFNEPAGRGRQATAGRESCSTRNDSAKQSSDGPVRVSAPRPRDARASSRHQGVDKARPPALRKSPNEGWVKPYWPPTACLAAPPPRLITANFRAR